LDVALFGNHKFLGRPHRGPSKDRAQVRARQSPRTHCDTGSQQARGKNKSFQFSRLQPG
jgi:hypothetical protein